MPQNKTSKDKSVLWWVLWITTTILSFFAASAFWTPFIASRFGSVRETGNAIIWIAAVFGTWMVILVPLIVVMYAKVDKAYEDARIRRENAAAQYRSFTLEKKLRTLPDRLQKELRSVPETLHGGHLTNARLKDGRTVTNLFIAGGEEILGIYDQSEMSFQPEDIVALEPVDMSKPPCFVPAKWLRLDGVSLSSH